MRETVKINNKNYFQLNTCDVPKNKAFMIILKYERHFIPITKVYLCMYFKDAKNV